MKVTVLRETEQEEDRASHLIELIQGGGEDDAIIYYYQSDMPPIQTIKLETLTIINIKPNSILLFLRRDDDIP